MQQFANAAFIDATNLHKGMSRLGWRLDYRRFRIYLRERLHVENAYAFFGYIPQYQHIYDNFEQWGYEVVLKQAQLGGSGDYKGNCDVELTVHAMCGCYDNLFSKAVLVSADGDFASLAQFLNGKGKLDRILAPSSRFCSSLLKRTQLPITYIEELRRKLER